jgi:L-threonylcarbamoyladenylate synthase
LTEASKKLYQLLRKIKKNGYKNISVTPIPNKDIGVAINDRLKRSAK